VKRAVTLGLIWLFLKNQWKFLALSRDDLPENTRNVVDLDFDRISDLPVEEGANMLRIGSLIFLGDVEN
jgi:hypothetical protein